MALTYVVFDEKARKAVGEIHKTKKVAETKVRGGSLDAVKEINLEALAEEAANMQDGGKISLVARMEQGEIEAFTEYFRMVRDGEW